VIPPSPGKPEVDQNGSEQIDQLLEIEFEQKRSEWKRQRGQYHTIRAISFLFLFLVIAGALLGFFFVFLRLQH
jgi:hypothetical protein